MSSALSQMRRIDELEAHYAVKKRELDALQREIAERQANLEDHSSAESSPTRPASAAKKAEVPSVGRCSVVMNALADRGYLETLPLYEAHNATSALRAAIDVEAQQIGILKRDIATLTTEYEQTNNRSSKAAKQYSNFKKETGYTEMPGIVQYKPKSSGAQQQQQQQQTSIKRTTGETEAQRGIRETKEAADEYILQLRKVEEHLKASHLLQKRLETSLKELDRANGVQHETEMKVDSFRNDVLVLDREIALKQAELLDLRNLQAGCDKEMASIERRRQKEHDLIGLINGEYRKVKNEASDVTEQRRQWEETIKAQDRRLAELRERKEMVDQAVEAHGLKQDVNRYVEAATAQRQADQVAPSPTEDLSDIISHYADPNMLAPPEEMVASGVVMLLTSLHDKMAHRVRCKEVLLDEKSSSSEALKEHVGGLIQGHDNSEDKLYVARVECEREVLDNVEIARAALNDFRDEYSALKGVALARQRKERSVKRQSQPKPEMNLKKK